MDLRPYQNEAVNAILNEWQDGHKKTLLVLPTGTGKTIVFTKVAENEVKQGKRVLVLAHRFELLQQAADKIKAVTGLDSALEKAEETSLGSFFRIVVGSIQTLTREKRLMQFCPDYFDTIIVDEAHHCMSESYQKVLAHFCNANILGVTATPERADLKNLGAYFESLAYEYTLPRAIREGYLVPIKAQTIPLELDIRKVAMQSGDFKAADVDEALAPYLDQIAEEMLKYCKDRKTVVFLPLVKTSKAFCALLNKKGFNAVEVNGESEDRAEKLKDFDEGKYNVICNSMLLTEGWDCPTVDCVIMLRPTKSRSLYCQCIGRGTRLAEGKKDLLILDFLWLIARHELCRPAHLIAKSKEVADKMTQKLQDSQMALELQEVEEEATTNIVAEREQALAAELEAMRKRKRALVDPLQFEMSIQDEDLANYVPTFMWEQAPATEKQLKALEKFGIFTDSVENAGKACKLLDRLHKRMESGLATPKQIRLLENKGFQHVGQWSFESASKMISRIALSKWRVPDGIIAEIYKPEDLQGERV